MKISFATPKSSDKIGGHNGYGYATLCILDSLQKLGYEVNDNDPTADVEFAFNQPRFWKFQSKDSYKIGYHPWESTQLIGGWAEIMNECDEIWTPSPLIADWYRRFAGVTVPVYVYEHGVEADWSPVKREPDHTIKFLHVGAEATRKGGWDTVRLFRRAFNGYRDDCTLTLKMIHSNWNQIPSLGKVKYINETYTKEQMHTLFNYHDVFVYPSWGEGFGLTPFQAMATGMPTILPPAWAPYKRFADPKLSVRVDLVKSPWQDIHPGMMLRPNADDVIDAMRYVADNYEQVRDFACSNAFDLHREYSWVDLTKKAFEDLESRLG